MDSIARVHLTEIDRKVAGLKECRSDLSRVLGSCSYGTIADCKIIETLAPRSATA